jgi:hypothetical protein
MVDGNGWEQHKIHVVAELHRMSNEFEGLRRVVEKQNAEIQVMWDRFKTFGLVMAVVVPAAVSILVRVIWR